MDTFGEWLCGQRNERKLTREQFAERIGCSVSALRKIENGERRPSAQIAALIANTLDIPSAERETFIRVARGELGTDRLTRVSSPIQRPNISPTQASTDPNLPVLPTPLIGRTREVDELHNLLSDPQCRLLTLVGTGGMGKTRLAIEAASQLQSEFSDGVYFVPLAPVNSARFIVPVITDSIGFTFQNENSAEPKSQLLNYLQEKQLLLLVDNLEHLLNDSFVIELFTQLLERAPKVKCLVTSREPINLHNEWVFEVHGLPIPENETAEGTSVELFLQRARRAHVSFNATADDYPAIIHICKLVDGMPLGIELAAAWVRTLSCKEIASEIERGMDFLHAFARDIPARHRSMRAVFDHSWKLLSDEEQPVLARLSIFKGGFQREAAEQVAGANLSVLSALVTKSLIRRNSIGRYDLHELVRQYALEELAKQAKVKNEAEERHSRYYLTFFASQDEHLRSSTQRDALTSITAEMDNIRVAWDWAVSHREFALIENTQRAYMLFFDIRGWLQDGLDHLEQAMRVLGKSKQGKVEQATLAHMLVSKGMLMFRQGKHEAAREALERSISLARPLDKPKILVMAVTLRGIVGYLAGDYAGANPLLMEGLELAREIEDAWQEALCLTNLGFIAQLTGDFEQAYEQSQAGLKVWRKVGDPRFTALALNFFGLSEAGRGRLVEAQSMLEECLALTISIGDRWGQGTAYRHLAILAHAQGDYARARDLFQQSLDLFHELGAQWDMARTLVNLGEVVVEAGGMDEAEQILCDALRISVKSQGVPVALDALVGLANLKAKRGDIQRAFELFEFVLNHPAAIQDTKSRAEKLRVELEEKLNAKDIKLIRTIVEGGTFESVVETILH